MQSFYRDLQALLDEGTTFVLCTVVASHGSTPQKPGSKLLVCADGRLFGTIGGGAIEQQIVDAARALLTDGARSTSTIETHLTHELGMCCGGRMSVFLEKHDAAPALVLFGAGHVAKEVAALARTVGFEVTVVDDRPEWLTVERFPNCSLRKALPDDIARELVTSTRHYLAVMTHDHPLDQRCVEALLDKPSAYLGVIGSQRKAERFRLRLRQAGFSQARIDRLESPMGVAIGALTPAEIAVSIVGRLVAVRRAERQQLKARHLATVSS